MSIPLTVKSQGQFAKRMSQRKDAWSAAQIAARLTITPGNEWWYINEFGAAPHSIDVHNAPTLLFPKEGTVWEPLHVNHPGTPAKHMITTVIPEIREEAMAKAHEAFTQGAADSPAILQAAVVSAVEQAKVLITDSIAELLPGHREAGEGPNDVGQIIEYPAGKLGGRTAAEVFEEEATVVEGASS